MIGLLSTMYVELYRSSWHWCSTMSAESLDRALALLRLGTTASMNKEELQQAVKDCWDFLCNSHVCAWVLGDMKLAAAGACALSACRRKKTRSRPCMPACAASHHPELDLRLLS